MQRPDRCLLNGAFHSLRLADGLMGEKASLGGSQSGDDVSWHRVNLIPRNMSHKHRAWDSERYQNLPAPKCQKPAYTRASRVFFTKR